MTAYAASKLWQALLAALLLVVVVFFAVQVIGDPVQMMLPPAAAPEVADQLRVELGLDRPLLERFLDYMSQVVTLDFGDSLTMREPALSLVVERLPKTALLAISSMGIALVGGVFLGTIGAVSRSRVLRGLSSTVITFASSCVDFWVALVLIVVFAVQLGWLPTRGYGVGSQLVLPSVALALRPLGRVAEVCRSAMSEEMEKDYVAAAQMRGIHPGRIAAFHVGRNSLVAVLTLTGFEFATMFTGAAVLVETIFGWPGIGTPIVNGIMARDLPVIIASTIVGALCVVVLHLIVDLVHGFVDPRIRRTG